MELFCKEYLVDLNATQAAIRAGYSAKTANEQGARLLAKVSIQDRVQQLKVKRSDRTEITADRVLKELASIGFAKVNDFLKIVEFHRPFASYDNESDDEKEKEDKPVRVASTYKVVDIKTTDQIKPEHLPAIASVKEGPNGIEFKLHDKVKALEMIGRHLGMFNDKLDITTKGESVKESPVDTSCLSDEELRTMNAIHKKMADSVIGKPS